MATVAELKKFKITANKEFDELTQWLNTTGYKTAPTAIKEYATTHCQSLLDEIEQYTADIKRREIHG